MKNFLRIILVTFIMLLPTLSQAQHNITQLVKDSVISVQQAEKIIQQQQADQHYLMVEEQHRIDHIIELVSICIVIILIALPILLSIVYFFRYLGKKDVREKEFLMGLVDKGAINNANNENLNSIINAKREKSITAQNKFLVDATMLGIGFAVMFSEITGGARINDFILFIAIILFFSGLLRLIVRTIFLIIEIQKKKRKNAENNSIEVIEVKNNETQQEQQ
ncbi:MAG: hypothetical protein IJY64_07845 [Bacteroidaceae bacterium]|nr:hypothetical protein [Bacteroidaceae bacterium]